MRQEELKRDEESYAIIGAAMAVSNELGHEFLEAVYQESLPTDNETNQVLNYLRAANLKKALLLNFGTPKLDYHRLAF